jgi:hypothetical protein
VSASAAITAIVVLAVRLGAHPAMAATLTVGDAIGPLALADQHGRPGAVDDATRLVLFSRDMAAGEVAKQALAGTDQTFLDARRAVYVADVSAMPRLVMRLFALPKLRDRPYRMLLDRDGSTARDVPAVAGRPTLLVLERRRILRVVQPATASELRAALDAAPSGEIEE